MNKKQKDLSFKIGSVIIILLLLILLLFQYYGKSERKTKKTETEQVQLKLKENQASKELENDLKRLTGDTPVIKDSKTITKKVNTPIKGGVFNYQGKPDLGFVKYDFGIFLTPVTQAGDIYVPIKFITKSYIKKLVPQIPGLKENTVPMTDLPNPKGRPLGKKWNLDKSGKVYYFVDFGQKVKKTNDSSIVQIPLNAYAGQKPSDYEIWLMYEAAVLNKQGFTQQWNGGNFISNDDGGYDYVASFSGFTYLEK
jgi:hypothetical protein